MDIEGQFAQSAECNGLKGAGGGMERRLRLLAPQEEEVVAEEDVQRRRGGVSRGEEDERRHTREIPRSSESATPNKGALRPKLIYAFFGYDLTFYYLLRLSFGEINHCRR